MTSSPPGFSEAELSLLGNSAWPLEKRAAQEKVIAWLGASELAIAQWIEAEQVPFHLTLSTRNGKISRGENDQGMPFALLDFPAHFSTEGHLAARLIWRWGEGWSLQVLRSGVFLETLDQEVWGEWAQGPESQDWLISVTSDPWSHHFSPTTFQPLSANNPWSWWREAVDNDFLKVATRLPMERTEQLPTWVIGQLVAALPLLGSPASTLD